MAQFATAAEELEQRRIVEEQ
eukprot:SAG31_NODE_14677_length_793_cov_1.113833_1_plen_20_part_01